MSKLLNKFLVNYSLITLRDVDAASLSEENVLRYDTVQSKWISRVLSIKNTLKVFRCSIVESITIESATVTVLASPELTGELVANGEVYII